MRCLYNRHPSFPITDVVEGAGIVSEFVLDLVGEDGRVLLLAVTLYRRQGGSRRRAVELRGFAFAVGGVRCVLMRRGGSGEGTARGWRCGRTRVVGAGCEVQGRREVVAAGGG